MIVVFSDAEVDSKQELLIIDDAEISDVEATEESAPVATGLKTQPYTSLLAT